MRGRGIAAKKDQPHYLETYHLIQDLYNFVYRILKSDISDQEKQRQYLVLLEKCKLCSDEGDETEQYVLEPIVENSNGIKDLTELTTLHYTNEEISGRRIEGEITMAKYLMLVARSRFYNHYPMR